MSTGGGPGGILSNGGFMASLTGGGSGHSQIPSISVSVQTEPSMMGSSVMANGGQTLLANGGGGIHKGGGNNINNSNRNNNTNNGNAAFMALQHHSATLPHPSTVARLDAAMQSEGTGIGLGGGHLGAGGVSSGNGQKCIVIRL